MLYKNDKEITVHPTLDTFAIVLFAFPRPIYAVRVLGFRTCSRIVFWSFRCFTSEHVLVSRTKVLKPLKEMAISCENRSPITTHERYDFSTISMF